MSHATSGLYEFGPFRLDVPGRLFTREGEVVPVAPKTFDLLLVLVQSPGRAFSKQELMAALWPDTFVEEANLSFQMSVLRKALGADAAQLIETVPKHGYRFTAEVRTPASASVSSTERLPEHSQRPSGTPAPSKWTRLVLATLLVAAAVGVALNVFNQPRRSASKPLYPLAVPLTAYPGFEQAPTLSPDGSQVAFSWNGSAQDNYDIYVKLIGPGEPWRLTKNPAHDIKPAWSPDGGQIAFLRLTSETVADLMLMPAHGGAERKIATIYPAYSRDRQFGNLSWTPDGRWLAFGGSLSLGGPRGIWLVAADGRETRRVTEGPPVSFGDISPVPSADGTRIAFIRERTFARGAVYVVALTAEGRPSGTARQLTVDSWGVVGLAWTPDSRDLLFSWGGPFGLSRLSRISATPDQREVPEPEPLPFGEQATALSVSKSGRIVYSAQFRDTALYEVPLFGTSHQPPRPYAVSSTFDEQTPHYSPDGQRLAFSSTRSGAQEIWVVNRDGSNLLQVTSTGGPHCSNPQWSPTGRAILFSSRKEGSADLYVLLPETGELRRLTDDPSDELEARWSHDGRWIYFGSNATGRYEIWRMPAEGGGKKQLTRQGGTSPSESAEGTFLYYAKNSSSPSSIWRVPIEGGAEERVVDGLSYAINFVVSDRGLYFVAVGDTAGKAYPAYSAGSIDYLDFVTNTRTTLVRLDKGWWYGVALSPDKQSLLLPMIESIGSNLMVVDDFRWR